MAVNNKSKLRLLLIPWHYLPYRGGVAECAANIARQFLNKNNEIMIVTRKEPQRPRQEKIEGVPVLRIYPHSAWADKFRKKHPLSILFRLIANVSSLPALAAVIRSFNPDVINLHYLSPSAAYVFLIAKFLNKRVVVSLHGELTQGLDNRNGFERWFFKKLLQRADYVTACSASLLKDAITAAPKIAARAKVVYNGTSLQGFFTKPDNQPKQYSQRYILTIANLWDYKGVDILLMAMKTVYDSGCGANLLIVGDGAEKAKLAHLAGLLGINDKVIFIGQVHDDLVKVNLLNGCEFFVLPSRIEPFGIVNLEAMAAAKAIVATDAGGVSEIVQDGVNGILVNPYDDKSLAEAIIKLSADEQLRERLGKSGREIAQDPKFSWANIAETYMEIYRKVAGCGFQ